MDWRLFVAWRNFKVRGGERFISMMSLFSVLGVAVGVAALIVVLAVMSGFDKELKSRIKGTTPAVIVACDEGIPYPNGELERRILESSEVTRISPFVQGQAMLKAGEDFTGVVINGIDTAKAENVTDIEKYVKQGTANLSRQGVLVGAELARYLRLGVGDKCSALSAVSKGPQDFVVEGIFESGLYDFDLSTIFVNIDSAQRLFGLQGTVTGLAIGIGDISRSDEAKGRIQRSLGRDYWVRSWTDMNKNLFGAILLEKIAMFAVLLLIVLVACLNIASGLIMKVMGKTKDIGILKAIGATDSDIRTIFRLEGLFIGIIGTVAGAGAGLSLVWLQTAYKFVKLPKEVYYLDSLPMFSQWYDIVVISSAAIAISFLATIYPASHAARMKVVDAIRYE